MKSNILIFIWEWNSEKAFLQEFLKKKYKISEENIKNNILYQIWNNFIIFAHPILWMNGHDWGDKKFKFPKTYVNINKNISSCCYTFKNNWKHDFIYVFLTDKDKQNSESKLDGVDELILKYCSNFPWKKQVIWAVKEIETWFLAWTWEEFIENYPEINKRELEKFYKKDIEKEDDTKGFLERVILKHTSIWTSTREFTWRDF